jgi:Lrp/AsnC family transcriptional regulator for asnA, asnC and gidA
MANPSNLTRLTSPGPIAAASRAPIFLETAVNLSAMDRALIQILQNDGRRTFASIAEDLGVTEKSVRSHVARLRSENIIEITTVTDPAVLGYHTSALVGVKNSQERTLSEIADELWTIPAVDYVAIVAGRYDLLVEVLCEDSVALLRTIETDVRRVIGPGATLEALPYLRVHYQEPRWEEAQAKEPEGDDEPYLLNDIDRRIVVELNADGRTPFTAIARKLGISDSQVRTRVAQLTSTGAVRIVALTNPGTLGFNTLAWLAVRVSAGAQAARLADRLRNLPSVTYLAICAGRFDLMAEVLCADLRHLAKLVDEEVRSLPELASVEVMTGLDLRYRRISPIPRDATPRPYSVSA